MTYLLLQTFLLLLSAYFLGAFVGCLARRNSATRALRPATVDVVPVTVHRPEAVALEMPRPIEAAQPKIEVLPRPKPYAKPEILDITRFERALVGPDPNEGMPRRMIVELRPAVLQSPTGAPQPWPPKPVEVARPVTSEPVAKEKKKAGEGEAVPSKNPDLKAPEKLRSDAPAEKQDASARNTARGHAPPSSGAAMATAAAAAAVSAARAAGGASTEPQKEKAPEKPAETAVQEKPSTESAPAASSGGDDLQSIRAIDGETERRLKAAGITRFDQIAFWTGEDIDRVAAELKLGARIDQEQWIEQAQILAKGGDTYYSRSRSAALSPGGEPQADGASAPVQQKKTAEAEKKQTSTPPAGGAASGSKEGRSVAEMANAAAAAIAAASASVTRGVRPIEPVSPLSRADPKIVMPTKLTDAIKVHDAKEKVGAASEPAAGRPAASPPAAAGGDGVKGDDLKRIRGIGLLIERQLFAIGITRYQQIANWSSSDIESISAKLDFKGRIERDNWVEQARILSSGGDTEFSKRVDKGEVDSSGGDT